MVTSRTATAVPDLYEDFCQVLRCQRPVADGGLPGRRGTDLVPTAVTCATASASAGQLDPIYVERVSTWP